MNTDTDSLTEEPEDLTPDHDLLDMAKKIADIIVDKQGEDILILDVRSLTVIADYFVIATCDNDRQSKSIAREIVDSTPVKRSNAMLDMEQQAASGWILIDLQDVIVHLFSPEQRAFYRLEELWRAARVVLKIQ